MPLLAQNKNILNVGLQHLNQLRDHCT